MIKTVITITVNRKSDIDIIQQKIIEQKMGSPVYIREYDSRFLIDITSDYEQWEMDTAILDCFAGYEFISAPERGRKETRLQISRYQSPLSLNDWGRPIEDPINETKYLVKRSNNEPEKLNQQIRVLFEGTERHYYINIVDGINENTEEKGFLLLNNLRTKNESDDVDFLKDKLYLSISDAFESGYHKIRELADKDFDLFLATKKKKLNEDQKVPRKTIRTFINACNKSDIEGILRTLDASVVFEIQKHWKTVSEVQGVDEIETYLKSPHQELCSKELKIRSHWNFNLPNVTIGVKFFPPANKVGEQPTLRYWQIQFGLNEDKIVSIILEI